MAIGSTTYTVVKKILGTVYNVVVSNFSDVSTWVLTIRGRVPQFVTTVSTLLKPTVTIRGRRPAFTTSTKLEQKPTQTVAGRRPTFAFTIKTEVRPSQTITGRKIGITSTSSLTVKPTQTITGRPITFVLSPIVGDINTLGDFDPETLATLDVMTLQDMDYTAT